MSSTEMGPASGPGLAEPPQLREKYGRLATEYSKLRSHMNVLKKGILDEQSKTAELKELLRDRELSLRKSELEVDSLNFRNHQLTKRVTVLQDDIESFQSHKGIKKVKHKKDERSSGSQFQQSANESLIQEELQKKIIENAQIVSQMADKDFEISQMKSRIADSEKQLTEVESKFRSEMLKLKIQNQELVNSLENALNLKETSSLVTQGTPSKIFVGGNKNLSINGDFTSEVGSLIGSEDALSTEESHLHDQLRKKTERLAEIEQENQSLKIEFDLMKLEVESLKAKLDEDGDENAAVTEMIRMPSCNLPESLKNQFGNADSPFVLSDELTARENSFKTYFRDKISSLVAEKQHCESTIRYHMDENEGMKAQLEFLKKEKSELQDALVGTQSIINKLEDELSSTNTNYEQQVILLSEHVGNLNDKLAQQVEEIQHLKGNLGAKK